MQPGCELSRWFDAFDLGFFSGAHFGKAPFAQPSAAARVTPLLTWDVLGRILAAAPPSNVLTVAAGRLVDVDAPRSREELDALMKKGVSAVVRCAEGQDAALTELARAFAVSFGGEVHVQLYATPAGTQSFGWHYDFEDVFVAQTCGSKDYFFRANTAARIQVLGETLDFTSVARETSPLHTARLLANDWLYLPSRWWHLVRCLEDSLSISVGVLSTSQLAKATRLPPGWTGRT
jgi:50S ribosomal protein L16 3-hydroxylase